jgi:hypothetical protein
VISGFVETRVLALALLLAIVGCGRRPAVTPETTTPPAAPFPPPTRLYYDNGGGIQDSLRLAITRADDFAAIWQRATSRQSEPPAPPALDFANEMVLVAGAGRMRADDQIAIDSVYRTRELNTANQLVEMLNVVVLTTTGCGRFNAVGYPLDIVRVRRFEGPVKFLEERAQAQGCTLPQE